MDSPQSTSTNERNKENEFTLLRASEISALITSTTIGPNSSFDFNSLNISIEEVKEKSIEQEKPLKTNRRSGGNRLQISDLKFLHDKLYQQSEQRRINSETFKYLEERKEREKEKYKKVQDELDKLKFDAERRHKEKMDALEKRIQNELKLEYEREQKYLNQRRELAANSRKILEEQEKQLELIRAHIKKIEETFIRLEAQFLNVLQSCSPEMSAITDAYVKQHKDIRNLKEGSKQSLDGSKMALAKLDALTQNLCKEKTEFENMMKARVAAQREAEEREKQQQQQQLQQQQEEAARQAARNVPTPIVLVHPHHNEVSQVITVKENADARNLYENYKQLLINMRNNTKLLEETKELQEVRFALKLVINNSINLLNEENKTTLVVAYQKLMSLLTGQRCSTSKGDVSVMDHVQASDWCRLQIAEKLIAHCVQNVKAPFSAASLIIAIWQKFPEFGEIFKAVLYKECPFLIPFRPPILPNMSEDEFLEASGIPLDIRSKGGHKFYEKKTSKLAELLAACWITQPKNGEGPNPFGIENGWRYMALLFNNPPDIFCLHLIATILEIAGSALHQTYGKQFIKIMLFLKNKYIPAVQSGVDELNTAAFNRLRDLVLNFFAENKFAEPKGKLSPGFW